MSLIVLLFGAFFDAFIGINLFVPGEPFLLAAGYQLYDGEWLGVVAVTLGGFLGDQMSFFIGKHLGAVAQDRLTNWQPKTKRAAARFRLLLRKKGNYVLVFARLLGPVAWVVPFLAGSQHLKWRRFTLYTGIGLILGVGQWVLWGYVLAAGINTFPWLYSIRNFCHTHQYVLLFLSFTIFMAFLFKSFLPPSKMKNKFLE